MRSFIYIFISAIILSGCSMKLEPTPLVLKAKRDYEAIKDDKHIINNAPKSLLQATKLYTLLEHAEDKKSASHLAYLLRAEVEVAKESSKIEMIKKKITDLQEEKNEVIKIQKEKELQKRSPKNLQDLNPIETDKGIVLTLEDELFENKKARLLIWSIGKIEKLAKFLKNNPNRKVFIAGFSDDLGTASYNLDFSIRRAEAVAKVLVASGVDSSRIITKGYGEEHPIAENNTQESRTKNRRVEIVILNEGEDIESILNTREILNP